MADRFQFISQLSLTGGGCLEFHMERNSETLARFSGRVLVLIINVCHGQSSRRRDSCTICLSFCSRPVSPKSD